ncbi:MAG TPA: FlgD immunoglobulin-like domain containing protein [Candidatus Eisenbacteria bacterium]|nr:FlgD immunoglobulin-like domain containing protein [Candidatus Eisenbacteria bacterium]
MRRTFVLLLLGTLCVLPVAASAAPLPVLWSLNPPAPCVEDSVVLVFRGYMPIWDQDPFYNNWVVMYRDSIARIARTGPETFVVRTVYRPDRWHGPDGYFGVPFGLGRLPAGSHHLTIEHHQLTQMLNGSLDSTVTSSAFDFEVAPSCPPIPEVSIPNLPWASSASVTPDPCPWKPMTLSMVGSFANSCGRVLLAATDDSANVRLVTRLFPDLRNVGCLDWDPPRTVTFPLGLPAPGTHSIKVAFLQRGLNYRWPPRPPERYVGVMNVSVPPTCGSLPERAALPYVTGVGVLSAGTCASSDAPAPGPGIPVAIRGVFPRGCLRVQGVELRTNPLGLQPPLVRVVVANDECEGLSCLESDVPWCVETRIPSLPEGRYALPIEVVQTGCFESLGPGSVMDAFTFDVPRSFAAAGDEGTVGVGSREPVPAGWLSDPWPNPSSGRVAFRLSVPTGNPWRAAIYDLSGRLVRRLHDGDSSAGSITLTWDGRDLNGSPVPDGVYFLRASLDGKSVSRRLVRLRGFD